MVDLKCIPDSLKEGENWPLLDIDPDWVWVVHEEERIVGMLIAAPCHGIVMIWRIKMAKSASPTSLLRLFRTFIKDIRRRRCLGYMAMVDVTRPEEQALMRIAFRAKGLLMPSAYSMICGSVATGHLGEV